jgi:peptidoglycan/LPS O-acetylase OafA/YrhL
MTQPAADPVAQPSAPRRRHVHEADVVRVLTFACVIAVHTIHYTNPASSVGANGVEMLLHFTREAFFCLTGFVLVHQNLSRRVAVGPFWRKRFVAVGVPYLVWSVIYEFVKQHESVLGTLRHLPEDVALGTAWYHLYFLLVSMQIYLVFPVILWLVRKTAGHHGILLAVSAAVQVVLTSWLMYAPPATGWLEHVTFNADALLPSYQFYVLAGAVAAFHFERTVGFVRDHRRAIFAGAVVIAAATELLYLADVHTGRDALTAANVLQPGMLPWSLAAVAVLLAIGTIWDDRRTAGSRWDRGLAVASDRSFGVFLVHPLILWCVLQVQARWWHVPCGPALSVGAYLVVVVGSLVFADAVRHTRLSLPLTGRRRLTPAGRPPATPPAGPQPRGEAHVHNGPDPSRARHEAAGEGHHDGDRRRSADALLR